MVEMLIVAPILILMIGVFISTMVSLTGDVLSAEKANKLSFNIQDALNRIEQDVKLSKSFLISSSTSPTSPNTITLTSPQGYDDSTAAFTNTGANGAMLILYTYTTTRNPLDPTYDLVYTPDTPYTCDSPLVNRNTPQMMNTIYFIKNSTLWRRVVANAGYATTEGCSTPWQKPTCTAGTGGICGTEDTKLIENIQTSGLVINYYESADDTSAILNPDSQTALDTCDTVGVTITAISTAAGQQITRAGTIRATIKPQ